MALKISPKVVAFRYFKCSPQNWYCSIFTILFGIYAMARIAFLTFNLKNIQTRLRKCTFGNISFRDIWESKESLSQGANNETPLSFLVSRVSAWHLGKWSQKIRKQQISCKGIYKKSFKMLYLSVSKLSVWNSKYIFFEGWGDWASFCHNNLSLATPPHSPFPCILGLKW